MNPPSSQESKEKQQETLAVKVMGFSLLAMALSIIPQAIVTIKLVASQYLLDTTSEYQKLLIDTPLPLIAFATSIGMSIALLLAWLATHIAPTHTPLARDAVIVTFGWCLSILGALVIWFIHTEKILNISLL